MLYLLTDFCIGPADPACPVRRQLGDMSYPQVSAAFKKTFKIDEWKNTNTSSGYKGVYFRASHLSNMCTDCSYPDKHTGRWQAGSSGGCTGLLGYYDTPEEAAVVFAQFFSRLEAVRQKRQKEDQSNGQSGPSSRPLKQQKKRLLTEIASQSPRPSRTPRVQFRPEQPKELFCICQAPQDDDLFYLGCDECGEWFHPDCLGMDAEMARIAASQPQWACYRCSPGTSRNLSEEWDTHTQAILTQTNNSVELEGCLPNGLRWLYCPPVTT